MRGQPTQNKAQQDGATEHVSELKIHSDHTRKIDALKPPTPHGDLVSPLTYTEVPPDAVSLSSIFFDLIERDYCSKGSHVSIFWRWNDIPYRAPNESDDRAERALAECRLSRKLSNNKDLLRMRERGCLCLFGVAEPNLP